MKNLSTLIISLLVLLVIASLSSCGSAEARRKATWENRVHEDVTHTTTTQLIEPFEIKVQRWETPTRLNKYDSTVTDLRTGKVHYREQRQLETKRK